MIVCCKRWANRKIPPNLAWASAASICGTRLRLRLVPLWILVVVVFFFSALPIRYAINFRLKQLTVCRVFSFQLETRMGRYPWAATETNPTIWIQFIIEFCFFCFPWQVIRNKWDMGFAMFISSVVYLFVFNFFAVVEEWNEIGKQFINNKNQFGIFICPAAPYSLFQRATCDIVCLCVWTANKPPICWRINVNVNQWVAQQSCCRGAQKSPLTAQVQRDTRFNNFLGIAFNEVIDTQIQ